MGARVLEAVATPGHTKGHLVFHDLDAGLLFSGDHVLPTISPSIGFELGEWSCRWATTSPRWTIWCGPTRSCCPRTVLPA